MKKLFSLLFVPLFFACNNSTQTVADNSDSPHLENKRHQNDLASGQDQNVIGLDFSGCYRQAVKRDTILLQIHQSGSTISGTMQFDNYEKDSSHGTVKGQVHGDTLTLWYDFNSEGMHSVMEIIYKKTDDGLVRAVGAILSKGDTTMYKDRGNLQFDPRQALTKIKCGE